MASGWNSLIDVMIEVCQIGILSIVFVGAVKMGERLAVTDESKITVASLIGCAALVLALHLGLFAIGVRSARWLNLAREDQIAVGFAGSQKTLMVGLTAAIELGFTIIPLVMYHVLQLVADTLLADRWRRSHSDRVSGM